MYSTQHIAKVWTLEATALSDAQQALINLRAGKKLKDAFAGKTEEDIQRDIQELLAKESYVGSAAVDEGVPPIGGKSELPLPMSEALDDINRRLMQELQAKDAECLAKDTEYAAKLAAKDMELRALRDQLALARDGSA
jgi:hypothetical protein